MNRNDQKLESISSLAHDLNNVLSPLLGYTELALEEVDSDSLAKKNMYKVYEVAKQAKELVREILDISRQKNTE